MILTELFLNPVEVKTMPKDIVDYFVNIKRPLELREDVLTTSNDIILLLKRTEKIKSIRQQKKQVLDSLKTQIKDINTLNTQLKHSLPRVRYQKDPAMPSQQQQKVSTAYVQQLKDLQKAIVEIEDKLRGF